jgi:hypothetical protein
MAILNFKNPGGNQRENVLELRWILIIATIYLVLFHRPLSATPPIVALFIAAYLGSNIVASRLLPKTRSPQLFEMAIVAFDAITVSVALLLTQNATSDFFLLYFIVMIIGTLSDRLEGVVATAILISVLHLYTTDCSSASPSSSSSPSSSATSSSAPGPPSGKRRKRATTR